MNDLIVNVMGFDIAREVAKRGVTVGQVVRERLGS